MEGGLHGRRLDKTSQLSGSRVRAASSSGSWQASCLAPAEPSNHACLPGPRGSWRAEAPSLGSWLLDGRVVVGLGQPLWEQGQAPAGGHWPFAWAILSKSLSAGHAGGDVIASKRFSLTLSSTGRTPVASSRR